MLERGFSLFEMLLAILLSSMIMMGIGAFYPQLQISVLNIYWQYRLEESVGQVMSGLIKDIKRAGFIANDPSVITQNSIEINNQNNCIIIRYDSDSVGKWRYTPLDPKTSDLFVYRYYKNNLQYQTGITHCQGSGWDKLFDANEVKITQFQIIPNHHYIEIKLNSELKKQQHINYIYHRLVRYENR